MGFWSCFSLWLGGHIISHSFLGLPYRILNMNPKKELLWGLWVIGLQALIAEAQTFFIQSQKQAVAKETKPQTLNPSTQGPDVLIPEPRKKSKAPNPNWTLENPSLRVSCHDFLIHGSLQTYKLFGGSGALNPKPLNLP